ncbi:nucleolus and neural progenitor protein [Heteronotia binoei]|uniref:nucleolus and neural progenitor protein n=1 Tax=Heteronotia binoei TaxID=13085 RepID=UPI0029304D1B|nr:nucleolus and neural progenitor protein [Heteronotia binoei]
MAAPAGSGEVWNQLDVPWPACSGTVAVSALHPSVKCLSSVMKRCHVVKNLLKSKAVVAEGETLHAIMHNFYYQMRHHRPYWSLRQVQQCLKRLNLMNLEQSVEKLAELGSMKQKSEHPKESLVLSQPVIEVVLVKILGGCKLLLRLLKCCCTAFLLYLKHLCLEEHILHNTVVLGLLSRLWILYRGVLKSLSSLYESLFELLQEVSQSQPRPYIKEFAFPSKINEFLGTDYLEIQKKMPKAFKKKTETSWLSKRFSVSKARKLVRAAVPSRLTNKMLKSLDVGQPVQINRTNQDLGNDLVFDVRTLCRHPDPALLEMNKFQVKPPHFKKRSTSLKSQHLKPFLTKLQEVHSFEELSNELRTTIHWCKSKKLRSQAFCLGMKLLKIRHLQHVEAQGCSLQRKLGYMKTTICRYLTVSYSRQKPKQGLGLKRQRKHSRNLSHNSKKTRSCFVPDWKKTICSDTISGGIPISFAQQFEYSSNVRDADKSCTRGIAGEPDEAVEGKPAHLQEEISKSKDDIDDIFEAIGI